MWPNLSDSRSEKFEKHILGETMLAGLKPYPRMKDSGVEWLGAVPAHWDVRRLRAAASILNGATPSTSREEYWDGDILWITPEDLGTLQGRRVTDGARKITAEGHASCGTSLAAFNSIVISTRAPIGHLGILSSAGCTNQGCKLLVPNADIAPEYLYEVLESARSELQSLGQGTTFAELSRSKLGSFRLPIPPPPEQNAIAHFLDRATSRIERYIRAKEKLIALLEEQKQVIVHDAVAGRIDVRTGKPYPAYEDSGLEWLGAVPAHWEIRRTKSLFRLRTEKSGSAHGLELLSIYTHIGVRPRKDLQEKGNKASTTDDYWIVNRGDLIANKLLAWMGAIGVSHYYGVTSPAYDILMPIVDLESDYYHLLFRSPTYLQQFKQYSRGIMDMRLRLYFDQFGQIPVAVPRIEEQKAIVDFCAKSTTGVKGKIDRATREIELLREYRTCLITDVVTGKLDVREAAAILPELDPVAGGEGAESSQPGLKSQLPNVPLRAETNT